ncbi:c-type cytochrome [Hymenobacter negativus]|uniref:C-type cytochrome n=1 Tax=Hymenobacter negativus TaxID=2795026 RepID=A0ABS3QJ32_9BACT|nr:c-type cytochrome [Hymenobacter negativus]MBO2011255.1 c-type cytochrome [Hymenobacter negativus]
MKKTALLLSLCALLAACDSGYKKDGPDEARTQTETNKPEGDSAAAANLAAVAQQPQIDTSVTNIGTEHPNAGTASVANGAKLIAGSDCLSCHKDNEKVVGPSYTAVAEKYPDTEANIAMLAGKIIKGGAGNWGAVPMTPHPGLSEADAREMTKYILSLK